MSVKCQNSARWNTDLLSQKVGVVHLLNHRREQNSAFKAGRKGVRSTFRAFKCKLWPCQRSKSGRSVFFYLANIFAGGNPITKDKQGAENHYQDPSNSLAFFLHEASFFRVLGSPRERKSEGPKLRKWTHAKIRRVPCPRLKADMSFRVWGCFHGLFIEKGGDFFVPWQVSCDLFTPHWKKDRKKSSYDSPLTLDTKPQMSLKKVLRSYFAQKTIKGTSIINHVLRKYFYLWSRHPSVTKPQEVKVIQY